VLAKRAKAIERSRSASATVGPCLEFNSPIYLEMKLATIYASSGGPDLGDGLNGALDV